MKVTDPQPPASDPNVKADDVDSCPDVDNDEPSAFAQVLEKKRGMEEDSARSRSGKDAEGGFDPARAGLVQPPAAFEPSLQTAPVESKRAVGVPIALQELVREISVATNTAGNQQVHIELNSNVLKGLHIVVERKDGAVAIQFQSTSDEVARLLSRNADALSQGLADRGVSVANIQVTGPPPSTRAQDNKGPSSLGGSWQRGGQGGRR
jgi:hypothetical protein